MIDHVKQVNVTSYMFILVVQAVCLKKGLDPKQIATKT